MMTYPPLKIDKLERGGGGLKKRLQLDRKKTIVWVPTHTDMSSFPFFIDFISPLSKEFNIILKAYPILDHSDNFKLLKEKIPECRIIDEKGISSEEIINIADFVLCDYGGSAFHAIYLDKNLILLNSDKQEIVSQLLKPDSPELEIRKNIVNFYKNEQLKFLDCIHNKSIWNTQKKLRTQYRKKYFGHNIAGIPSKIIANYLLNLLNS